MRQIKNAFRRLLSRLESRFTRSRPGSVLIMVVALLVLMALIGTAYLITARQDRVSARIYDHNIQIDILIGQLLNMVESAVQNPVNPASWQQSSATGGQRYDDWATSAASPVTPIDPTTIYGTTPGVLLAAPTNGVSVDHTWLAARYPVPLTNAEVFGYAYPAISGAAASAAPRRPYTFYNGTFVASVSGVSKNLINTLENNPALPLLSTPGNPTGWYQYTPGAGLSGSSPSGANAGSICVWPAVSSVSAILPAATFEDPRYPVALYDQAASPVAPYPSPANAVRTMVSPTYISLTNAATNPPTVQNYPALEYFNSSSLQTEVAMAASASGDGIADSFLFRMPCGTIDGVTYYGAYRVIDDNSAVNINTANTGFSDFAANGASYFNAPGANTDVWCAFMPGTFPAGVGLAELTWSFVNSGVIPSADQPDTAANYGAEYAALNLFRCNGLNSGHPTGICFSGTTIYDDSNQYPVPGSPPGPYPRTDTAFRTEGDALWNMIGRRVANPGVITVSGGNPVNYQAFGWGDSVALAYKFDLCNFAASPSNAEVVFANSVYNRNGKVPNAFPFNLSTNGWAPPAISNGFQWFAFDPSFTNVQGSPPTGWFAANYIEGSGNQMVNRRPFLVARNPTNNCMPAHDLTVLPLSVQILMGGPSQASLTSVDSGPYYNTLPGNSPQGAIPRVSLNTADITAQDRQLNASSDFGNVANPNFAAVYNVATGSTVNAGASTGTYATNNLNIAYNVPSKGPSLWLGFYNAMADVLALPAPQGLTPPYYNPALAQFRNPIRGTTTFPTVPALQLNLLNAVLLRSLIAAVNAKDLRDSDDDVTHVQASYQTTGAGPVPVLSAITNTGGNVAADVHVYGLEKQPFITEVYFNSETVGPAKIATPGDATFKTLRVNPQAGKLNPKGYVAIELYNPYDVDINITGWTLGLMTRTGVPMSMRTISGFAGFGLGSDTQSCIIFHKSYMILENIPSPLGSVPNTAADATYRPYATYGAGGIPTPPYPTIAPTMAAEPAGPWGAPPATEQFGQGGTFTFTPGVAFHYVPNLHEVIPDPANSLPGGELYILRQLPANGTVVGGGIIPPLGPPGSPAPFTWAALTHFAPVDMFDFTGFSQPEASTLCMACHYQRANGLGQNLGYVTQSWQFVYPGRWDPVRYNLPGGYTINFNTPTGGGAFRQEGIAISVWDATLTPPANPPNPQQYMDIWQGFPPGTGSAFADPGFTGNYAIPNPNVPGATIGGKPANTGGNALVPWSYAAPIILGNHGANTLAISTYFNPFPGIQLNTTDMGGPTKMNSNNYAIYSAAMFPFGGFARTGDVLQVPFIGSYMILAPAVGAGATPAQIYEINPVTTDSQLADDNDTQYAFIPAGGAAGAFPVPADDSLEQIGRFCPIFSSQQNMETPMGGAPISSYLFQYGYPGLSNGQTGVQAAQAGAPVINGGQTLPATDAYGWCSRIFDYFTAIQNPHDDYLPNVDPNLYPQTQTGAFKPNGFMTPRYYSNAGNSNGASYANITGAPAISRPTAVPNLQQSALQQSNNPTGQTSVNFGHEDLAGVDGLININTANVRVLGTVPWVVPSTQGMVGAAQNTLANASPTYAAAYIMNTVTIPNAIVNYRNTYGPFKSLFDLNKVPLPFTTMVIFPGWRSGISVPSTGQTTNQPLTLQQLYAIPGWYGGCVNAGGNMAPMQVLAGAINAGTNYASLYSGVNNDWQSRFATQIRLSNILTTRSDTFTVYATVQGWTGVSTGNPQLVSVRRAAAIIDRSSFTASSGSAVNVINIPSD